MQVRNLTTSALLSAAKLFQLPLFAQNYSISTSSSTMTSRQPVISIPHGGGPMPVLNDPGHAALIKSLTTKIPSLLHLGTPSAPRAIVLVTAHWSTRQPTISNGEKHELYFDYGGFPDEAYKLKYDATGDPGVAGEVFEVLEKAGLGPRMDGERGWDHGVFIPMLLINPPANIPIIQLSVLTTSSPSTHFSIGRALSPLRDRGIAILGSGMPTFHNLRLLFSGVMHDKEFMKRNKEWSEKLSEAVLTESSVERGKMLEGWRGWLGAEEAHPRGGEEHFWPLVVCAGAAGEGKGIGFADEIMGGEQVTYHWN